MLRVVSIIALFYSSCFGHEPQCICSKYHYEESLLEKMIRTEIQFEELQKKLDTTLKEEQNNLDAMLKEQQNNLDAMLKEQQHNLDARLKEQQNNLDAMLKQTVNKTDFIEEEMNRFTERSKRDREETMATINQEKVNINESLTQINKLAGE